MQEQEGRVSDLLTLDYPEEENMRRLKSQTSGCERNTECVYRAQINVCVVRT